VVFTDDKTKEFSLESLGKFTIEISSEMADFHIDTSLDDDQDFNGFTAEEVLQATKKCADIRELDLSDISFSEVLSDEEDSPGDLDSEAENDVTWSGDLSRIQIPQFTESVGPTTILDAGENELDFLFLLFPHSLFRDISDQTNLYADQLQHKLQREDRQWKRTTLTEIMAFIGIRIYMSILQLPSMDMYWSTDYMFGNLFG